MWAYLVVWWAGALLRMQKDRNCWWDCGHHFQSGTWTLEGLFFSRTFLFLSKVLGGLFVTFSTCSNRCQPIPKISSCTWNTPLNFAWKCLASLTVFLDRKWHFSSLIPMFLSSSCSWLGQFHQESAQMCSTIQATPFEANPVFAWEQVCTTSWEKCCYLLSPPRNHSWSCYYSLAQCPRLSEGPLPWSSEAVLPGIILDSANRLECDSLSSRSAPPGRGAGNAQLIICLDQGKKAGRLIPQFIIPQFKHYPGLSSVQLPAFLILSSLGLADKKMECSVKTERFCW